MMSFFEKAWAHVYPQFGDMEKYTAVVLATIIIVWTIGSIANRGIANSAFSRFAPILGDQFAEPGSSLIKESNSHYFVYSTGRARCSGQIVSLKLSPRNDLLSRFVLSWIWKTWYPQDRLVIEVFDTEIDPAVTGFVCRKYMAEKLVDKRAEVKKFCKAFNGALENGPYAAFSSSSLTGFTFICDAGGRAAGPSVFGRSATNPPAFLLKNLESIYVSGETKSLTVELAAIPSSDSEWKELINYVLSGLLDGLAAVKLSESVRTEVAAQRSQESEKAAREAEQSKRREELQKQKEEQLKSMSVHEREKLNEKRREKEKKKNMKSGRIML